VFEDPTESAAGVFTADSIIARGAINIQSGNDVDISGKLLADGATGSITIHADGNATIEGVAPDLDPNALAAISELNASSQISISSGALTRIAESGRLNVDDGGVGASSGIALTAGTDALIAGELFSLAEVAISAGDNVALEKAAITTGSLIDVNAGVGDDIGGISGDIFTELSTTGGGNINLTAGANSGDIDIVESSISTTGSVSLVAAGGGVSHGGATIVATDLYARAATGISANTRIARLDASISGVGDLLLTNGGNLVLDSVVANDGKIEIVNFGGLTANRVETLGTSDTNDILLTAYGVGQTASDLDFTVIRAGGAGDVTLDIEGAINPVSTVAEPDPMIVADQLSIVVQGGLDLSTQVNELSVETTDVGDVVIDETDGVVLGVVVVADGSLMVTADGNLVAEDVRLVTNAISRNVELETTGGDIEVGLVQAGVFAASATEADAIQLEYFNAALRAINVILPDDGDASTHDDEDWTLARARDISQETDYSQIRDALIALLETNGASNAEAIAEANAILSLETLLTSLGAISLTASGAIRQMAAADNEVDLIADEVTLVAGGDIGGLEIAVNTIVDADSDTGSIILSDFDGVDEKQPGLVVMSATSQSTATAGIAISTQGDLKVGLLKADETIDVGEVSVGGADSTLELVSSDGNLIVYDGGNLSVSGGVTLIAGGLVRAPDLPMVSDRVEIRAGTTFDFAALTQLDITADTIIIETGQTIDVDGTLAATNLVELVSNDGNVIISGTVGGQGANDLAQLIVASNGIGTTTEYVLDDESGFVRYLDSVGNIYLGDLDNGLFYTWQDSDSDRFSFTGIDTLTGDVEIFYSTTSDPSAGTIYLADNTTIADPASISNLVPVYLQYIDQADGLTYALQDPATGRFSFSGLNTLTGNIETFFSTTIDLSAGTIYLADNATTIDPADVSNLAPVYLEVNGQVTIADLTPVTDSVSVGNVYLRGSGNMQATDMSLTALNGEIRRTTDRIVTATTFSAQAGTGIDLVTDVDIADLAVTGVGDVVIDEADGIILGKVTVADGAMTVDAAGTVTVGHLVSFTDSASNGLAITTTSGDILVDSILMAGSESTVALTADGDISETNYFDPDPDSTQDPSFDPNQDPYLDIGANTPLLLSTGGGTVYHNVLFPPDDDGDIGLEISSAAVTRDYIISVDGDIVIDRDVIGIVDVTATGTITVLNLTAGEGSIRLNAGLDIRIDYLDAGATGVADLTAGRSIYEVDAFDGSVDLIAQNLIATTGDPGNLAGTSAELDLETAIETLDATIPNGSVGLNEQDDIVLVGDLDVTGDIGIIAGGSISLPAVVAADGGIRLDSGGAITGVTGHRVTTTFLDITAAGDVILNTDVDQLTAGVTGTGNLVLTETDEIELVDLSTTDGDVTVEAGGAITAVSVISLSDSDENDITLRTTSGPIGIGTVDAGIRGDVILDSAAGISGGLLIAEDLVGPVMADDLTINAQGSVMLNTTVNNLVANLAAAGSIEINETDAITLESVQTFDGAIDVTAAGQIVATSVQAGGAIGDSVAMVTTAGGALATSVTAADSIVVDAAAGDIAIGSIVAVSGSVSVSAVGGSINDVEDDLVQDIGAATAISLLARDEIGGLPTADTTVDQLGKLELAAGSNVTASSTLAGDIVLGGLGALTLTDISVADGSIDIMAAGDITATQLVSQTDSDDNNIALMTAAGSIAIGSVDAGALGDVLLEASSHVAGGQVSADLLLVTAGDYLSLNTTVTRFEASAGTYININESDDILVNDPNDVTFTAVSAANGSISFTAGGSITVGSVVSQTDGNDITLDAQGDITIVSAVDAGVTGNVDLDAGNNVAGTLLTAGLLSVDAGGAIDLETTLSNLAVTAGGAITIAESDDIDSAEIHGGIGAVSLNAGGAVTLTDVDTINGPIDVLAGGNIIAVSVISLTDLETNDITLESTGGSIAIEPGTVDAGTAGDVSLAASGDVTGSTGAGIHVMADALTVIAGGLIDLDTTAASLVASAGSTIDIEETDAIELTDVDTANGNIGLTAGGNITAVSVVSQTDGNAITLASTGGSIDVTTEVNAGSAGSVDLDASANVVGDGLITSGVLVVDAGGAIDLDTTVSILVATAGGAIMIDETDAIVLSSVVTTNGPITAIAGDRRNRCNRAQQRGDDQRSDHGHRGRQYHRRIGGLADR
jgi:hypothetical protein